VNKVTFVAVYIKLYWHHFIISIERMIKAYYCVYKDRKQLR